MIADDVIFEGDVLVRQPQLVNLYGCVVGGGTRIGAFVEIQKNARIGRNCKISSHSFICEGVLIEDEVFIGHNVTFTNDKEPRSTRDDGQPVEEGDWVLAPVRVCKGASIGSGSVILAGVTIGEGALIGAGSVVTRDIPPGVVAFGSPAKVHRKR